MKKIFSLFILIFILYLNSICFAGVGFGEEDFEEFLSCYGYNIDFSNADFVNTTYDTFSSEISRTDYPLVVFEFTNGAKFLEPYSETEYNVYGDLVVYTAYTSTPKNLTFTEYLFKDDSGDNYYYFKYRSNCFVLDTSSDTVTYLNNYRFTREDWHQKYSSSYTEFKSDSYQESLFRNSGIIYCERDLYSSNGTVLFDNQGGAISSSTINDTTYKGSISYLVDTQTCNLSYTQGFDGNTNYDLFMEIYRLSSSYNYGIGFYPIDTIDLGSVKTSDVSCIVDANEYMDSMHYVYRICVGDNNFYTSGSNDVYLSTDWLVCNDYTVTYYTDFSTWHYMDLLDLSSYIPPSEDVSSGDSGSDVGSGDSNIGDSGNLGEDNNDDIEDWFDDYISNQVTVNLTPYFINKLDGYYDLSGDVILNVRDVLSDNYDINDYYLKIFCYRENLDEYGNLSGVKLISSDILYNTWINFNDNGYWVVNLSDFYSFSTEYVYVVKLFDQYGNQKDTSKVFCFNTDLNYATDNDISIDNNLNINTNSDFNTLINGTTSWVSNIFGFLNIFPSWFVTCIISAISVVVICRIFGR